MQQTTDKSHRTLIKKLLVGFVIFVIIAAGTVLIINTFMPIRKKTVVEVPNKTVSEIFKKYLNPKPINSLSSDIYVYSQNTITTAPIIYMATGHAYTVSVPATDSLLFSSKAIQKSDDGATVRNQTTTVLQQLGLKQVNDVTPATNQDQRYTTFADSTTVCQLTESASVSFATMPRTYEFTCADNTKINDTYNKIENMLSLYKKSSQLKSFTMATSYTNSKDNKSYTILNLTKDNYRAHSLLFASVNKDQQFIADFEAGDSKYSNGKYVITPETLKAISDPKYDGFLLKNLTGQSKPQ